MTTNSQSKAARPELDELQERFSSIVELDVDEDLVRMRSLGDMSFAPFREEFQNTIEQIDRLRALQWEHLSTDQVQEVVNSLTSLNRSFQAVQEFTVENAQSSERDRLAKNVRGQFDNLRRVTTPFAGYLSWLSVDIDSLRRDIQNEADVARETVNRLVQSITERQAEAEQAVQAIREASAEAGVAHHASTFATAAERHEDASATWMKRAVSVGLATVAAAFVLVFIMETSGNISDGHVLQIVLAKAVVLSIGFYFTVSSVRLYRSHTHLAVVNRHREDSLKTFRAFVEGAGDDEETKSKVLLEATHAAFGQAPTGLVPEGSSSGVVEVLDGVTGLVRRSQ